MRSTVFDTQSQIQNLRKQLTLQLVLGSNQIRRGFCRKTVGRLDRVLRKWILVTRGHAAFMRHTVQVDFTQRAAAYIKMQCLSLSLQLCLCSVLRHLTSIAAYHSHKIFGRRHDRSDRPNHPRCQPVQHSPTNTDQVPKRTHIRTISVRDHLGPINAHESRVRAIHDRFHLPMASNANSIEPVYQPLVDPYLQ